MEGYRFTGKDGGNKKAVIEGDFSEFDRVFYQRDKKAGSDLLFLFSAKKQEFMRFDLGKEQAVPLRLPAEQNYQQVEMIDRKIFCVNRETLTMDVFFLSRKESQYHRRTICFTNNTAGLKEDFSLLVWENQAEGSSYHCLLGPLEDGRFMSFDLSKKQFDVTLGKSQVSVRVIFLKLSLEEQKDCPPDVLCTVDRAKKSVICYDRSEHGFFEYNGFLGEKSRLMNLMYKGNIENNAIKKMYFYYPYEYLPEKEQNQILAAARRINLKKDIDSFLRERYMEILLCMEKGPLHKLRSVEESYYIEKEFLWRISRIDTDEPWEPTDVAVNTSTGEIYYLLKDTIRALKNSGREMVKASEEASGAVKSGRRNTIYESNIIS